MMDSESNVDDLANRLRKYKDSGFLSDAFLADIAEALRIIEHLRPHIIRPHTHGYVQDGDMVWLEIANNKILPAFYLTTDCLYQRIFLTTEGEMKFAGHLEGKWFRLWSSKPSEKERPEKNWE
jgi:hypothetical protein